MSKVQFITSPSGDELAILPRAEYERLVRLANDDETPQERADTDRVLADLRSGKEETFPAGLVDRLLDGANPIKLFREYRKKSQGNLASHAELSQVYISQLERGARTGTVDIYRRIAKVLEVDIDLLLPR